MIISNGLYTHSIINHSTNFVDPNDSETHTQNVENLWMHAKRKIKSKFGISNSLFPSYLCEFAWREKNRSCYLFSALIKCVSEQYMF